MPFYKLIASILEGVSPNRQLALRCLLAVFSWLNFIPTLVTFRSQVELGGGLPRVVQSTHAPAGHHRPICEKPLARASQ